MGSKFCLALRPPQICTIMRFRTVFIVVVSHVQSISYTIQAALVDQVIEHLLQIANHTHPWGALVDTHEHVSRGI